MSKQNLTSEQIADRLTKLTQFANGPSETYTEVHFAVAAKRASDGKYSVTAGSVYSSDDTPNMSYTTNPGNDGDLTHLTTQIQTVGAELQKMHDQGSDTDVK